MPKWEFLEMHRQRRLLVWPRNRPQGGATSVLVQPSVMAAKHLVCHGYETTARLRRRAAIVIGFMEPLPSAP